jgi:hypothetical protein
MREDRVLSPALGNFKSYPNFSPSSLGTPLAVQQKLMRHTDIRTTMNVYGDVITNQESEALGKIAHLALANSTLDRLTY